MSATRPTNHEAEQAWEACPAGELQGLASRLKIRERRQQQMTTLKTIGGAAVVAGMLVLAVGLLPGGIAPGGHDGPGNPGGLTCMECYAGFDDYQRHLTSQELQSAIDEQLVASVSAHLEQCDMCRDKFEKMYPGVLQQAIFNLLPPPVAMIATW